MMLNRLLARSAAVVLVSAAALSTSGAQTDRRTISSDRIAIYNLAGKIRLQSGSGSQVSVEVTRGGHDASQLRIETGDIRGWQTLRVVYPSDRIVYPAMGSRSRTQMRVNSDGTFGDDNGDRGWSSRDRVEIRGSGSGLEAYADVVVGIPRGQRIAVHLGVGDAVVSNVDGDVRVDVAAASIMSEHTRGRLDLDTGSGEVSVTDAQGEVTLDTGSGRVTVNGVSGPSLDMDTGSGSISAANIDVKTLKADVGSGGLRIDRLKAPRISVDAGSGGVDLDIQSAIEDLYVDAGSGGVTLRLPSSVSASVDIETGSGGIDSDFAVQTNRFRRNRLQGQIGDGRGRIRIESGSGSVRLIKG